MRLLLDTSAVLYLTQGRLSAAAEGALRSGAEALVSPVVPWELAIKSQSGKLQLPLPPLDSCKAVADRYRLTLIRGGLNADTLCASATLPLIHRDPFDRILIATAIREQMVILTSDRTIPLYPVETIW